MIGFIQRHWTYLLGALLLHVLFAGIFGLTLVSMSSNAPPPQLAIQAIVVDQAALTRASRQQQRELERERAQEREAAQRQQREAEQQRAAEQRAAQERQAELKEREAAEQRRQAEERVLRERQAAERKRAAEAERQEAERKRVAEIERKQKEEADRRRAAQEARDQQARESELRDQLAAEEGVMEARGSPAMSQYVAMIRQHVERRWVKPLSAREGLECEVRVAQTPGGVVLSAEVGRCNGDAAVKQSIENAVHRASPLPPPPDPRMFERNLVFIFKPQA